MFVVCVEDIFLPRVFSRNMPWFVKCELNDLLGYLRNKPIRRWIHDFKKYILKKFDSVLLFSDC